MQNDEVMKELIRQFIYQGYATKEFEKFNKTWLFRTLSPREHDDIVDYVTKLTNKESIRQKTYESFVLKKALLSINGLELSDEQKDKLLDNLPTVMFDSIYESYHELEKLQTEALLHEDLIKELVKPSFDRIKFLVMQEVKALPTEQRVKDMNDYQWMWYWYNMQQKVTEDEDLAKAKQDYLCMFINPELWKHIRDSEQIKNATNSSGTAHSEIIGNTKITYGDTTTDEDFDKKLQYMMQNSNDEFTELPGSTEKGNVNEKPQDFFQRVLDNQDYVKDFNQQHKLKKEEDLDLIFPIEE